MRIARISKAVALGAAAALALSACAANTGTTPSTSAPAATGSEAPAMGGEVRVVEVNPFTSFNTNTANGNVDINSKIAYTMNGSFNYIDKDLNVVKNEKFGTYEVLSQDPLSVKYTVNDGVKWSDGEAVNADDLVFAWAIVSGHFNDSKIDENTGKVTSGTTYFDYAGDTTGMNLTDVPVVGDDNRSVTLNFSKPFADWEISFNPMTPAHVAAKKAGMSTADLTKMLMNTPKGDPAKPVAVNKDLKKVSDFWNTGYDTKSLPTDKDLYLSSGPFIVKDIVPDRSMTLVKNPDYTWGPEPKVDSIVVRYIADSAAQVTALKNGEVDIIAPQASTDTLQQLQALGDTINIEQGQQLAYDHLDLNFTGVFKDSDVREAFMKTVPRQQIVDTVIGKLVPDAKPLDSQIFVPANASYAAAVAANGSTDFNAVDIDGAKKLLKGATPTVRIMYNKENPNRLDAYSLIAESATQAGFKVVDGGLPGNQWGAALGNGTYDASIFGWTSPGVGVSGVPQLFGSKSSSNFSGFKNADADKLMDELVITPDKAKQDELQIQIDTLLWKARYGLPLFQSAGIQAYSSNIGGVQFMPNQTGVWWNFWDWSVNS
ncbi:ABC transporter family substrate-binding protein [Paeniglutamicibacter cryotolerans]|uniref:Peptide/nickel transport system substrate-binding protein n=1 Tax=Paeniglutamicibacter cryotolerans TaxID=670079 RepID=A0A839QP19_9MICC|nr:ABC transporter family substrate-binding protein [Paeniglutamicibacter cryotolerans]MBB2993821.1 peptide/nickel transport system substrate-binding protein [Paeniglutamicibacter cryotolerans]